MEMNCVMPPRMGYSHARELIELIDCSFPVIPSYMGIYKRKFTNNYRKMHGLPMTRYRALNKVRRRYVIWTKKYDPYIFRQSKLYERTLLDYDCLANKHPSEDWCSTRPYVIGIDLAEERDWCCSEMVWPKNNPYLCFGIPLIDQNKVCVIKVAGEEKSDG